MKELLVKDYRILLSQKKNLILILAIGFFMVFTTFTMDFMVGYLMMLTMILSTGTVNYDEIDNGMAFIMTLPASRKTYAIEKYVLTFVNVVICGVMIFGFYLLTKGFMNWGLGVGDMVATIAGWICGIMLSSAILLPLYLKFGVEKRRVIMLILWGFVAIVLYAAQSLINNLATDGVADGGSVVIGDIVTGIEMMNPAIIVLGIVGITVVCVMISILISIRIMKKKEF